MLDKGKETIEHIFDTIVKVQENEAERKKKMIEGHLSLDE